jgi:DNA-binding MarR family transcriptional regulator
MRSSAAPLKILDRETAARPTDHAALKLWLRMLTCTILVEGNVRTFLRQSYNTTLPRFDLMSQLHRNPEGLRMVELSERMMVTCANVTGITDQLEREGLVQRKIPEGDRRSFIVKLTSRGRRVFTGMAKAHEELIQQILSGLTQEQLYQLHDLLAIVKRSTLKLAAENVVRIEDRSGTSGVGQASTRKSK